MGGARNKIITILIDTIPAISPPEKHPMNNPLLSGDELQINMVIGNTLPQLYAEREDAASSKVTIIPAADNNDALKSLLIVITVYDLADSNFHTDAGC